MTEAELLAAGWERDDSQNHVTRAGAAWVKVLPRLGANLWVRHWPFSPPIWDAAAKLRDGAGRAVGVELCYANDLTPAQVQRWFAAAAKALARVGA